MTPSDRGPASSGAVRATSKPDDDSALVQRCQQGDTEAFGQIAERHRSSLQRTIARYVVDSHEVEDLTQTALQRAHMALATFRGESSLRTWLHRIAINVALNHVRSGRKNDLTIEEAEPATFPFRTTRVVARSLRDKLALALGQLPENQRLVVELRLLQELSFAEVAKAAGCSEDAAKMTYHRALGRIRELIPQD